MVRTINGNSEVTNLHLVRLVEVLFVEVGLRAEKMSKTARVVISVMARQGGEVSERQSREVLND